MTNILVIICIVVSLIAIFISIKSRSDINNSIITLKAQLTDITNSIQNSNKESQKDIELLISKSISSSNIEFINQINQQFNLQESKIKDLRESVIKLLNDGLMKQNENAMKSSNEQQAILKELNNSVTQSLDNLKTANETKLLEIVKTVNISNESLKDTLNSILKESIVAQNETINNLKTSLTNMLQDGLKQQADFTQKSGIQQQEQISQLYEIISRSIESLKTTNDSKLTEIVNLVGVKTDSLKDSVNSILTDGIKAQNETIMSISKQQQESQELMSNKIKESLTEIRQTNEQKLDSINREISDKLDKSLNERLDSTFGQIGDRLNSLYESLGELNKLTTGVSDLNKTLSNVKTRGIWGEIQLQSILEDTMTPSQYDTNAITKKGSSDRVEFAIKIPSKSDDKESIYLPIDSKFPADIYGRIVDASERYDSVALELATKELERRIKDEAKSIHDKYIDPPNTTDFAIMFIPTESLYSEVLRIDGLYEWCQTNYKIIISGPTTISALLNSLRVGFSNLTLNKKTQEVIKTLQAVKTQYGQLDELIDKTQKKLTEAVSSTDKLKDRTRIIQKKMSKIEMLDQNEADKLLGIGMKDIDDE